MTIWLRRTGIVIALAGAIHLATVWAIPWLIVGVFAQRIAGSTGINTVYTPPLPSPRDHLVVAPSPDLLYAICLLDTAAGTVRITAGPAAGYWSLALYDRNADNIFRTGSAADAKVELLLGRAASAGTLAARFPAATYIQAPHETAILLGRFLVADRARPEAAIAARATVRCEKTE